MFPLRRKLNFLEECRLALESLETFDFKDILLLHTRSYSGSFHISLNVFLLFFSFSELCVLDMLRFYSLRGV